MNTILRLYKEYNEIQINSKNGFNRLNLISAKINNPKYYDGIPSVEMILLNDKFMFNSFSNLIPGTNSLNCFDLLKTSINNSRLINEKFHTLKCVLKNSLINELCEIVLEFEYD